MNSKKSRPLRSPYVISATDFNVTIFVHYTLNDIASIPKSIVRKRAEDFLLIQVCIAELVRNYGFGDIASAVAVQLNDLD